MSVISRIKHWPGLSVFLLVLAFRVVAGVLFSATLLYGPEGHMLIILDLPALATVGISQRLFGVPDGFTDAFSADYLISSAVGWLIVASIAGLGTAWLAARRRAHSAS